MRRVIDDTMYEKISDDIMHFVDFMPIKSVSKYEWGMDRIQVSKVKAYISNRFTELEVPVKFCKTEHAHGIGNNNAIEIVWCGEEKEEQICGLLHLNTDMYGGIYCYCTDVDGGTKTDVIHYRG